MATKWEDLSEKERKVLMRRFKKQREADFKRWLDNVRKRNDESSAKLKRHEDVD